MPSRGTIEGLESSWESPGLGARRATWVVPPTLGHRFEVEVEGGPLTTGTVRSIRVLGPRKLGFRTNRTTYVLTMDPGGEGGRDDGD